MRERLVAVLGGIINPVTALGSFDQMQAVKHTLLVLTQWLKFRLIILVHFALLPGC